MDLARPGLSMKLRVRFKVTISTMVTTLTLGVTVEAPRSSTDPVAGRSFRFDSDETLIGPDGAVYDVFYPSHDEKARENLFFYSVLEPGRDVYNMQRLRGRSTSGGV